MRTSLFIYYLTSIGSVPFTSTCEVVIPCFGLHIDCYLPGYAEGVDGVRRQHGGHPILQVQHNSLKGLGLELIRKIREKWCVSLSSSIGEIKMQPMGSSLIVRYTYTMWGRSGGWCVGIIERSCMLHICNPCWIYNSGLHIYYIYEILQSKSQKIFFV